MLLAVVNSQYSVREVLSCKVGCKQVVFPSPYWDQVSDAAKVYHCTFASPILSLVRPGRGAEYCDQPVCCASVCVCLSASISLEALDRSSRNFVCRSPVAVARSSSGGVALRYVLPVLWMTSRLAVMGARPARVGSTQRRRSIMCATGAESDVYECLFFTIFSVGTVAGVQSWSQTVTDYRRRDREAECLMLCR